MILSSFINIANVNIVQANSNGFGGNNDGHNSFYNNLYSDSSGKIYLDESASGSGVYDGYNEYINNYYGKSWTPSYTVGGNGTSMLEKSFNPSTGEASAWYYSPYGLFLNAQARRIRLNGNGYDSDLETKSISFSQNYADGTKPNIFIGRANLFTQGGIDQNPLPDAKTGVAYINDGTGKFTSDNSALILNSGQTLDSNADNEIQRLGGKNLYVFGGTEVIDLTYAVSTKYNLTRCGGIDRYETLQFWEKLYNGYNANLNPLNLNRSNLSQLCVNAGGQITNGEVADGVYTMNGGSIDSSYNNIISKMNFQDGVNYILRYVNTIGTTSNISQRSPSLIYKKGTAYFIIYYKNGGTGVWQTMGQDYQDDNKQPDLTPVDLQIKSQDNTQSVDQYSLEFGKSYKLAYRVKNQGNVQATGTYTNQPYLDSTNLSQATLSNTAAGATSDWQYVDFTASTEGSHVLKVDVDTSNAITESNESNNEATLNIAVIKNTPPPPVSGGAITFDPNSTDWTNKGKINEGSGSYPITVTYTGSNPAVLQGSATIHHHEEIPNPPIVVPGTPAGPDGKGGSPGYSIPQPPTIIDYSYTSNFNVSYTLQSITVSGDANATISGASGVVNITKEGQNLHLSAVGTWGSAVYTLPTPGANESIVSQTIPTAPTAPTGSSGYYNLDWTKSPININPRATSSWINHSLYVDVTSTDNLSGFKSGSNVNVTDYSHYGNNGTDNLPVGGKNYYKSVYLQDGMYNISVTSNDIAGNTNNDSSQSYLIDATLPTCSFNIPSGIFSEANGAVRKQNGNGNFSYFGNLSYQDNLSGVSKCDYSWTFGTADSGTYTNIYTCGYTYNDRYLETHNTEIEKPVGDNMYLHVKLYDTAGNYTTQMFGPYEDPIKLKNFEVTDVRDPNWDSVFWTKPYTVPSSTTYTVDKLPIDKDSHPTLKNATPKMGYAFYFDLTSEYLYRDNDRIEVTPSFYYWDGTNRTPVDCYYNLNNNPFIQVGSSSDISSLSINTNKFGNVGIGSFSKLTLTRGVRIDNGQAWSNWKNTVQYINGKEQWWYGKYYLPSTAIFVKHGDNPRPENLLKDNNIIVNFQIIAYKNGIETFSKDQIFSYVPKQWELEKGPKGGTYKDGDIILYDNKYNSQSNFTTFITQ